MIADHECVVLTEDLPHHALKRGAVGVVVMVHERPAAGYEVEFFDECGDTIDVVSVYAPQVRLATPDELTARDTQRAAARASSQ